MKIYLEVYGCTANQADACLIKGILIKEGHVFIDDPAESDVIVILTCTVINTTEQKMLSRLRKFIVFNKKIIVAGCMASVQRKIIHDISSDIIFLPPQNVHQINDFLKNKHTALVNANKTDFDKFYDGISAPILISEGCRFNCTYCITTLARGDLVSYTIKDIISDTKVAIKNGCKEIFFTGQDTSSYGYGTNDDLGDLLKEVSVINEDFRVRVGMMNPFTCLNNVNSILNGYESNKIYKFIHLPVQSGDDVVLSRMNRLYKVEDFVGLVEKFRKRYPDITLATDLIVGFPGESEEQFERSVDLIKEIKPDITNITRFSARPKTPAKVMKGRVKTDVVKDRSRRLSKICNSVSYDNNLKFLDRTFKVLINEHGKNNTFMGRIKNYKPVVIKDKVDLGDFVDVTISKVFSNYLFGSIK